MSTVMTSFDQPTLRSRRERRAERRRLKRVDMVSGRLAELHAIRALLVQAAEVIGNGWVQGAWFTVATSTGERPLTAYEVRLTAGREVTGACLVGAIVHAAGGPAAVRSQLVQRTLGLAWHTLREEPDRRVRWCPGPDVRVMRVLDLTRWNDAPGRTQGEVIDLLLAAREVADLERDKCRGDLAEVCGAHVAPL